MIGETGSGKSTQLCQYLLDDLLSDQHETRNILCSEPRKLATTSLAKRVSMEYKDELGGLIGYNVGGKKMISSKTRVCFTLDRVIKIKRKIRIIR